MVCIYVYMYLCIYVSMSLCLYVSMSLCLYVSMSLCLPVCLYVCMSVCLYVCMSVCLYECLNVWMSECLSVCLNICLSVCLSGWLSGWLSVCLCVCMCVCLYVCMWIGGAFPDYVPLGSCWCNVLSLMTNGVATSAWNSFLTGACSLGVLSQRERQSCPLGAGMIKDIYMGIVAVLWSSSHSHPPRMTNFVDHAQRNAP